MRQVQCYDCGKRYNYDIDDFCPRCGAFTQPARASRIAADGSVVWNDGINERGHHKSFVHKEYHQENRKRSKTWLEGAIQKRGAGMHLGELNLKSKAVTAKKNPANLLFRLLAFILIMNVILRVLMSLIL